ncbi:hypothetical protein QA635_06625 [Bradyrhizobium brasilense]|uniref:hypothetical protein n=1 Tax=Bradyrhizobium brasilense TaxID=1419277 RepID=UPI0024B23523|nr:hypothetical protein [Bradyrhizobium australafricanum]WFU34109.1 hypothetical protein QA635_06625 [Bradyrhizobium australafricanum]
MTENEMNLLVALAGMVDQFCGSSKGFADLQAMSAPQQAAAVLADYGLMKIFDARSAQWTEAGRKLLEDADSVVQSRLAEVLKPEHRDVTPVRDAGVWILKSRDR